MQGFVLVHAGEEFVPALPIAMLLVAWLLLSWAGKGDRGEATADQDQQRGADEAEHDTAEPHEPVSV